MKPFADREGAARFAVAALLWGLAAAAALSALDEDSGRADFAAYYAASRLVLEGDAAAMYARHANGTQFPDEIQAAMRERGYAGSSIPPYFSHPSIALALVPLALPDYPTAARVWAALLIGGQVLLGLLLWRRGWLGPVESGGLVLFMLLGYAGRRALAFGQFQVAILILVGLAMALGSRRAHLLALPPVVLAKPLFAPLLLARPRDMTVTLLALLPWLAVPLALGTGTYAAFLRPLAEHAGRFPIYAAQQGLLAQTIRLVQGVPIAEERWVHLHAPAPGSVALYIALAVPLAALGLWQLRRHRETPMRVAAMIATSLSVSPFMWAHYAVLFVLPLVAVVRHRPGLVPVGLALGGVLVSNLPYRYHDPAWILVLRCNVTLGALMQLAAVSLAERTAPGAASEARPAAGA